MTCIGILIGSPAAGQQRTRIIAEADSALFAGNLVLADSLYFIAVRYWPRDPQARTSLGRYLGARGKAKPAVVLLEEARMFGGSPVETGKLLAPLYEQLGSWRALLTLPGSPLSIAERRRAAWLSEHTFGALADNSTATMVGAPAGDTIARVPVRLGGKTVLASIVGNDAGIIAGTRLAESVARRFEGDPTVVLFDSMAVAQMRFMNVPATVGPEASSVTIGAAALGRFVVQLEYGKRRIVVSRTDAAKAEARYPLLRWDGEMRVLDRDRWIPLPTFAATVAKSAKTLVIDVATGEVRVRP
jgi:hypothetical protein